MARVPENNSAGEEHCHRDSDIQFEAWVQGAPVESVGCEEEGVACLFGGEDAVGGVGHYVEAARCDGHEEELGFEVAVSGDFLH